MSATAVETATTTEHQLGRIQYIDPETSVDPWDCDYFAIPRARSVTQHIHSLHDVGPEIFQDPSPYSLETHAFTAVKQKSVLHSPPHTKESFLSTETVEGVYLPEVISLVKSVTGAQKCFVVNYAIRHKEAEPPPKTEAEKAADPPAEPERCGIKLDVARMDLTKPLIAGHKKREVGPARSVHIDYSPEGARKMIRCHRSDILEEMKDIIEAEDEAVASGKEYTGRRYAFYSVWRPLKKVTRDPLAICDPNTIDAETDLIEHLNKHPSVNGDFVAGLYMLSGKEAEKQKWYWIKEQKEDEVYVIQFFDNYAEREGRPVGAPHGSPELMDLANEDLRESCESRVLAVW